MAEGPVDSRPIAITGASGFIGRALTGHLRRSGHNVRAITRSGARLDDDRVSTHPIDDYKSTEALIEAIQGCRCVVHLADQPDRKAYTQTNMGDAAIVAASLAKAMDATGVAHLVAISSIYATASATGVITPYGSSKYLMESALFEAPGMAGRTIILRLPPVYGPGSKGALAKLAQFIRWHVPLPFASATAPRPLLAVANLNSLIETIANSDGEQWKRGAGKIYSPSDAVPVNLATLVRMVGSATGRRALLIPVPGIDRFIGKPIDAWSGPRSGRLDEDFGWIAPYGPPATLAYLGQP